MREERRFFLFSECFFTYSLTKLRAWKKLVTVSNTIFNLLIKFIIATSYSGSLRTTLLFQQLLIYIIYNKKNIDKLFIWWYYVVATKKRWLHPSLQQTVKKTVTCNIDLNIEILINAAYLCEIWSGFFYTFLI